MMVDIWTVRTALHAYVLLCIYYGKL